MGKSGLSDIKGRTISVGFDKNIKDGLVGLAVSMGNHESNLGAESEVDADSLSLMVYNIFNLDYEYRLQSIFGFSRMDYDTKRADGAEMLTGNREGQQWFVSVKAKGKDFEYGDWFINPYAKFSFAHTTLNAFSEQGGDNALTFDEQTVN